ncbi:MAG: 4-hydroxy-tetrahydrodipicolinate synthase, partial [Firmicutes bacterium]|nr:4-hydroxy-tetrahydrodipicolinate synthase [Bacillota bacterium]
HGNVIARMAREDVFVMAGAGSNSTREMLKYGEAARAMGCDGLLLVDCYYNGPSSLELREEYYRPAAEKFTDLLICPYVIPGRTGCALLPEDMRVLAHRYPNVGAVKEATGDLERMRETRRIMPDRFHIISGDDDLTYKMMTDEQIGASGVISVISNVAPGAMKEMCDCILKGENDRARGIKEALEPLLSMVTVACGQHKFRNPVPVKTMMRGLGMPAGGCRQPLGRMLHEGVEKVRNAIREVWEKNPEILQPIEDFYGVNIAERLENKDSWF